MGLVVVIFILAGSLAFGALLAVFDEHVKWERTNDIYENTLSERLLRLLKLEDDGEDDEVEDEEELEELFW